MRNHHRTTTTKPWHSTQFQDTYYPLTTTQYEPNIKSDEPLIVHIKSVLNVKNSTIDKHLLNFFNIDNPDPLYIFVLPDATKNRTVVLRKSNFSPATFPNISILDKRIQSHSSTFKSLPQSQLLPAESKRIQRSKLLLDDSSSVENDASTEDEQNVVAENVRTEKNFFKFMDRLNNGRLSNDVEDQPTAAALQQIQGDHLYEIDDVLPSGYRFPLENPGDSFYHRQKYPKRSTKISWKDLGLNGWSGRLSKPGIRYRKGKSLEATEQYEFSTTNDAYEETTRNQQFFYTKIPDRRPKEPRYLYTTPHYRPDKQYDQTHAGSYTPLPERPKVVRFPSKPIPSSTPIPATTHVDSWEVELKIPEDLMRIIYEENTKLHRHNYNGATTTTIDPNDDGMKRNAKPVWPVTSSRASHRDEVVFIARANNPFGHSTKWKTSNTSSMSLSSVEYENRTKRGALELYSMVKCSTGCDPLIFKGYGCYCGFLGAGRTLDGIDRCCKMHDYCYETANCPMFLEYFVPYLWKCYRGQALCAIDHGEWGGPGSCASRLCECDQALSKCLRRFYCPRKRAVCTTSPLRLLQNVIMEPFSL